MALGLSAAMMLAAAGCGGDDPLTSSWSNTSCYGSTKIPDGIKSCSTELTFTAGLEFSVTAKQFSEPATATAPGCTTTRHAAGQTWSTDGSSFTLEGGAEATIARSSCVNATDEFDAGPTTDISVAAGSSAYVITDNSLTIASGPLAGTYTN